MANWNDIKAGVGKAANKTMKKAGEIADSASLKFKLTTQKAKLSDRFERLGRLTYKQLKTETSYAEDIATVISEIDELRESIKEIKAKIEAAKEERARAKEEKADDGIGEEDTAEE